MPLVSLCLHLSTLIHVLVEDWVVACRQTSLGIVLGCVS